MLAWMQANIMTMWAKKGRSIKVDDLLPKEDRERKPQSRAEFVAMMEQKRREMYPDPEED